MIVTRAATQRANKELKYLVVKIHTHAHALKYAISQPNTLSLEQLIHMILTLNVDIGQAKAMKMGICTLKQAILEIVVLVSTVHLQALDLRDAISKPNTLSQAQLIQMIQTMNQDMIHRKEMEMSFYTQTPHTQAIMETVKKTYTQVIQLAYDHMQVLILAMPPTQAITTGIG